VDTARYLWIGIGTQSGVTFPTIRSAIESVCDRANLDIANIIGLATLDRKATELALASYCQESDWMLKSYTPAQLATVTSASHSRSVLDYIGTPSVAEAAALLAAQTDRLLVPKQKFRADARHKWVTIAIAQAAID
jgi:cobalamin biosynthesis protein CbiG